jgi:hypothetical protein
MMNDERTLVWSTPGLMAGKILRETTHDVEEWETPAR